MPKIKDYTDAQGAIGLRQGSAIDSIVTSQSGLTDDIANLNATIVALQASQGQVTPEDQALLDQAQAQGEALATKAEGVAAALQALDQQTPPAVPAG